MFDYPVGRHSLLRQFQRFNLAELKRPAQWPENYFALTRHLRSIAKSSLLLLVLMLALPLAAKPSEPALTEKLSQALAAIEVGHRSEANLLFQQVLNSSHRYSDLHRKALISLVENLLAEGKNRAAMERLDGADKHRLDAEAVRILAVLRAQALIGLGRFPDARDALDQTERVSADDPLWHMTAGILAAETGDYRSAGKRFNEAAVLASQVEKPVFEAKALLNVIRAQFDDKDLRRIEPQFARVNELIRALPQPHVRAPLYLALGELYMRGIDEFHYTEDWFSLAHAVFSEASIDEGGPALKAYAQGFLGRLYEVRQRYAEALRLSTQALFFAQQIPVEEQVYRWQWQVARIQAHLSQLSGARDSYQSAVSSLNKVKSNFVLGSPKTFKTKVEPVYTQYADVLLQLTRQLPPGEKLQSELRKVRDLLETLKQAEIEDYFANECVAQQTDPEEGILAAGGAAIIYPVFLEDRVELLIEADAKLAQFTTPVGVNQVTQTIRKFRVSLERPAAGNAYLEPSRKLYHWLIEPALTFLEQHNVDTLVIVPEGALRTVPVAALHDGNQFLVQKYAIATTPAVRLIQELRATDLQKVLVGGLSEGVQGFAALPSVENEIEMVSSIYRSQPLENETFKLGTVTSELGNGGFSVAHFATHGEFSSDHRKSFILTYDNRLTLDGLETVLQQRGDEPLDLLVLSACKTAAGDDRAALGLAGVAVQSGANSALASLWYISDAATAALMEDFYRELNDEKEGKAESLRRAQISLIETPGFSHPSFWAPYLLIGNWL